VAARLIRPAAVLLDLDGTLLDSEPLWSAAAGRMARAHGCVWSAGDDDTVVGWSVPAVAEYLRGRGASPAPAQIVDRLHADVAADLDRGLPWRPGALAFLALLLDAGIPAALVTMTYGHVAHTVVAAAPPDSLRVVVAGDDVRHPKPDPDAYLIAARRLGVDPHECIAVEDSPTGIASALASGALTFAVDPHQHVPSGLAGHPRLRRGDGLAAVDAWVRAGADAGAVSSL
jgi:HAD superfamily hydrolase (TIGR01509 family)